MANDTKIVKRAFNAGEISIRAKWRNDTEKHAYSCEKLENFYVSPLGAISRREGTRLLDSFSEVNCRIIPFEYNRDLSRILLFKEKQKTSGEVFTTKKFAIGDYWSICFKIPKDFIPTERFTIIEYGDLRIDFDENEVVYFTKGDDKFKLEKEGSCVIITFAKLGGLGDEEVKATGELKFYRGDDYYDFFDPEMIVNTSVWADFSQELPLIFRSDKWGCLWDLQIYDYVLTNGGENIFSLTDYFEGNNQKLVHIVKNEYPVDDPLKIYDLELRDNETGNDTASGVIEGYHIISLEHIPKGADVKVQCNYQKDISIVEATNVSYDIHIDNLSVESKGIVLMRTPAEEFEYEKKDFIVESSAVDLSVSANGSWSVLDQGGGIIHAEVFVTGTFTITVSGHNIFESLDGKWTHEYDTTVSVYDINGNLIKGDIETPIWASSLQEVQFKQAGGWLFFSHSNFVPQKFSVGDDSFEFVDAVSLQPSITDKIEDLVFTCEDDHDTKGVFFKGDVSRIKANSAFFKQKHIGQQFRIEYLDDVSPRYEWANTTSLDGKVTDIFPAQGETTVCPQGGAWDGTLILEESTDGGKNWLEIGRTTSVRGSDNTSFLREVYDVQSVVRARMIEQNVVKSDENVKWSSQELGVKFNIQRNSTSSVWVEIIAIYSETEAKVKFLNPTRKNFQSKRVYNSCWNYEFGYPRAVEIHEERLVFAGNKNQPSTIWLSQTNNWDNFRSVSNLDTDPLAYTLASDDGESISWLVSRSDLMIGLGNSEWSLGSREQGKALTASIVQASNQSDDGVEYIMPTKAGGMVIFVRRGERELASISYDFASDNYNAISLSTMHPELLDGGVVNIFNQLSPNNKIYVVCKNGNLAVFTYDKENNVAAWGRFTFGDGVISACALSTGKFKSIFIIAKRDGYLCLERLDPNELETNNWLDCVPINKNMSVPDGLNTSVKYESLVKTTPVFLEGSVKVFDVKLYLINSLGGKFRIVGFNLNGDETADEWRNILPRESEFLQEAKPRNYRYVGACDVGYLEEGSIEISTDETAPFELTAIGIKAKG